MAAIVSDFGSFENFKAKMTTATVAVQGSGWGWLVCSFILFKHILSISVVKFFICQYSDKIFVKGPRASLILHLFGRQIEPTSHEGLDSNPQIKCLLQINTDKELEDKYRVCLFLMHKLLTNQS